MNELPKRFRYKDVGPFWSYGCVMLSGATWYVHTAYGCREFNGYLSDIPNPASDPIHTFEWLDYNHDWHNLNTTKRPDQSKTKWSYYRSIDNGSEKTKVSGIDIRIWRSRLKKCWCANIFDKRVELRHSDKEIAKFEALVLLWDRCNRIIRELKENEGIGVNDVL